MNSEIGYEANVAPPPIKHKLSAYARLAKLDIFDYYLSLLLVWSLLSPAERFAPENLAMLGLFLLGQVCVVAAMVSFDDVTGYYDGSDAINYGPDAPVRRLARKPLLAGTLRVADAVRFGWMSAATAVLVWGGAIVVAPHQPLWAIAAVVVCLVASVQYSWGLKLSYHGWQELFLIGLGVGWVLGTYGLLSGSAGGLAVEQAILFGLGPLLFGVYGNTNDIDGDRAVGRITVATISSPRWNTIFIATLSVGETLLIVGSALVGLTPWWFPIAMSPVIALRARQVLAGLVRGDALIARMIGMRAHRTAVLILVGFNVVYPVIGGGI